MKLTKEQRALLIAITDSCTTLDCTGGCRYGWYEPLEGGTLRCAQALQRKELVDLTNGSHPRWVAGHVTKLGRDTRATLGDRQDAADAEAFLAAQQRGIRVAVFTDEELAVLEHRIPRPLAAPRPQH